MKKITVDGELLERLYRLKILLKYNSPAPADGIYGWLKEGKELTLNHDVRIEQNVGLYGGPYAPMAGGKRSCGLATVGAFTYSMSALPDELNVGRYCSISRNVNFIDSDHPTDQLTTSAFLFRRWNHLFKEFHTEGVREFAEGFSPKGKPYPTIGHDVWIGDNVTMSMGIHIGTGAILAANSTVTKDVPPYAIVGGNPAKLIKFRVPESVIEPLLRSEWWEYNPQQIFTSVENDFDRVIRGISDGRFERYVFESFEITEDQ